MDEQQLDELIPYYIALNRKTYMDEDKEINQLWAFDNGDKYGIELVDADREMVLQTIEDFVNKQVPKIPEGAEFPRRGE